MNRKLYAGVLDAIHWMEAHLSEHPELLTILTRLRDGERAERRDANDTESGIYPED